MDVDEINKFNLIPSATSKANSAMRRSLQTDIYDVFVARIVFFELVLPVKNSSCSDFFFAEQEIYPYLIKKLLYL